jgi:hypothetical protein
VPPFSVAVVPGPIGTFTRNVAAEDDLLLLELRAADRRLPAEARGALRFETHHRSFTRPTRLRRTAAERAQVRLHASRRARTT